MPFPSRPIAFVLAASNHGSMIVNRNDYHRPAPDRCFGVGYQILDKSNYDPEEINLALTMLNFRRQYFGDGVVAVDGGANIGVHTIEWARHMWGWGEVTGFEAQEAIFYALAGNVALNNCMNAHVRLAALGEINGEIDVPRPDYFAPASFGSLELRQSSDAPFIGQEIAYDADSCAKVPLVSLDSLELDRLDLLKLDVEGMELEVMRGAWRTLERHHPIMLIEAIRSDASALEEFVLDLGYDVYPAGINMLAIHASDPSRGHVKR